MPTMPPQMPTHHIYYHHLPTTCLLCGKDKKVAQLTRNRGSPRFAGHRACKCRRRKGRPGVLLSAMRPAVNTQSQHTGAKDLLLRTSKRLGSRWRCPGSGVVRLRDSIFAEIPRAALVVSSCKGAVRLACVVEKERFRVYRLAFQLNCRLSITMIDGHLLLTRCPPLFSCSSSPVSLLLVLCFTLPRQGLECWIELCCWRCQHHDPR